MKYLLLIFMFVQLKSELDLTIPEQPLVLMPEKKFLHFNYYREPPTKAQMITFWKLNALDVITTYDGLKQCRTCKEANILYSDKPSLGQLVVGKIIIGSLIGNNISKKPMHFMNGQLAIVVVKNYSVYN